jgi:phosphoenolpyruvate carboxykinase (ATP)
MHCAANVDKKGKNTALFFGLSGTGKILFLLTKIAV